MMCNKKKVLATAAACVLVSAMAAGGTFAYLTDSEGAVNTFTVGKVQVDLTEPNFPGNDSEEVKDLVPNEEVAKNPKVTNTGVNDALIFMTVEVPVREVTLAAADGTKGDKGPTELFWFKTAEDTRGTFANHFNTADWMQLTEKETHGTVDGSTTTYVFAYRRAVAAESQTASLFDKVQLKNIIENEVTPGAAQDIKVRTYAIQASAVLEGDSDLTDGLTGENLSKIYDIYLKQAGTMDTKEAESGNRLDLKGNTL